MPPTEHRSMLAAAHMTPSEYRALRAAAKSEGLSISAALRAAARAYVNARSAEVAAQERPA